MTNLNFHDYLCNHNQFIRSKRYLPHPRLKTDIFYTSKEKEIPYIINNDSGFHRDNYLNICISPNSILSRMTSKKVELLLDTCSVPLIFSIEGQKYLGGKGFLAKYDNNIIEVLFIACKPQSITSYELEMKDIRFYVARSLSNEPKVLRIPLLNMINKHVGDVVTTSKMDDYVGHRIEYPVFKTITQAKEYKASFVTHCLSKIRRELP